MENSLGGFHSQPFNDYARFNPSRTVFLAFTEDELEGIGKDGIDLSDFYLIEIHFSYSTEEGMSVSFNEEVFHRVRTKEEAHRIIDQYLHRGGGLIWLGIENKIDIFADLDNEYQLAYTRQYLYEVSEQYLTGQEVDIKTICLEHRLGVMRLAD